MQDAATRNVTKQGHPKGLFMLFMVEMWERFNYYGMRALLVLFMTSEVIQYSKERASEIYGDFTAFVYLTPVLGGYLADRFIGKRHSITIGAILMALGQFSLASYEIIDPKLALITGLVLIIIGNGFFKPNISTIVGELYEPNDPRRDSGFTIFYMGINLGAFFAPFVCGFLGEPSAETMHSIFGYQFHFAAQWKYGFMAAGIGMIIGLVWYLVSQKKYLGEIGLYPVTSKKSVEHIENKPLTQEEWDKIKAIFTFVFFAVFFFAFFEQAGSSLNFFAAESTKLDYKIFGYTINLKASYFQSINPICVILFAPLFAKMWKKMGEKEPSIPTKFGFGLFLLGLAFVFMVYASTLKGPVSALWLVFTYIFCTMGELCLSPVGLSMVTKLAPLKFLSLFMGVWLMASFFGNELAGKLASYYESWSLTTLFSVPAIGSMLFGVIMWIMTRKIQHWMHGVK